MKSSDLRIRYVDVTSLTPYPGNARTHSKKQIAQIAASIRQFGFNNPVLIDSAYQVIAGHGRILAASNLGILKVPTVRLDHLSDAERRAYIIADNRLAELAGWDQEILRIELQHLTGLDLNFDVEITGFETSELDFLLDGDASPLDAADDIPPTPEGRPVTQPGDLWLLGDDHRLICADATSEASYLQLMEGKLARMVFSDPPYNVPIEGNVSGLGKVKHTDFKMASGEMSAAQFTDFLRDAFRCMSAASEDGSIHYHCMDWRHIAELQAAGAAVYSELKNLIVWNKTNAGMGTFYRSKHELIFAFKNGTATHTNNFRLGETGRYRSNVWDYPGVNTFRTNRDEELSLHPTVKPVALVADAIKDVTRRGEIVLDAFGGSGTTVIAAEKTKRQARLVELDPNYCDVICLRFAKFAGKSVIHAKTGQTFEERLDLLSRKVDR